MATHRKPTIKELDESIQATIKDLDEKKPDDQAEDQPDDEKSDRPDNETDEPVEEETPAETPPVKEPEKKPDEKKPDEQKPDYEQRYKDSTSEAQILYSKNKKITDAIAKAGEVPEPTEEELVQEYGDDWDTMSAFEQRIAKENLTTKRKLAAITEATKEFKELDAWNGKVDAFLTDPKTIANHPELDGREDEFKLFATKPTRVGVNFSDLTASFLYSTQGKPAKKKGSMFEVGAAGAKDKPAMHTDKISVEESRILRTTDYKKYIQLVREGKIDNTL